MTGNTQRIPTDFEWTGFVHRNSNILIDPQAPPRTLANVQFPNMNHPSTQPLVAGSLERKGKMLRSYKTGYYVVTPSKYLHEFETDDDLAKDPTPEISLFLPDCIVGALDGAKFAVKGKDVSKGKLGVNVSTTHEYQFKAHTPADAQTWYHIIKSAAGQVTADLPEASAPTSPATQTSQDSSLNAALAEKQPAPLQTQGITDTEKVASPAGATPASATAATPATTGTTAATEEAAPPAAVPEKA
jgi:hypothetical protein